MGDPEYREGFKICTLWSVPKGMRVVLVERGTSTAGKNPEWMHKELASHRDIKHDMNLIEHLLRQKGVFLPKFHPEINPIERVWAQLKRFTKGHCNTHYHHCRRNHWDMVWLLWNISSLSQGHVCIFGGTKAWS